jgi:replication fork clamp-binding protein CrfC
LNLTLVDLPGITKVPTGDQPEDVEDQIRNMCYEFISNPNAIILAVSAANQDLVNSDGLKMARSVDPDGERTIGVLTKVDIMDQGTDCADILSNRVVPLRRGYIAVVNRSQKEIQENVPIRAGLAKEQTFFQAHPKYRSMLSKCGTQNLARTLNQILIQHIRHCLPEIKAKINSMLADVQTNMDALGEPMDAQGSSKLGAILLRILSKYSSNVSSSIEWNGSSHEQNIVMTELFGGARIAYIFSEIFGKRLRNFDALDGLSDEDIRTVIANANGPRQALLVSIQSFDVLVRTQIAKLEHPGLQCVELIFDEMCRIAGHAITAELHRFPDLKERVFDVVNVLLRNCMLPTQKMISNIVAVELAYLNIAHPDFVGGKQAVALAHQNRANIKQQAQSGSHGMPMSSPAGATTIIPAMAAADMQSPGPSGANESNKKIMVMSSPTPQPSSTNPAPTPPIPASVGPQAGFLGLFRPASERSNNTQAASAATSQTMSTPIRDTNRSGNGYGFPMEETKSPVAATNSGLVSLPQVPDRMRCGTNPNEREM